MKFNLALLDLNQVILLFPSFDEGYYERGRCLFILGQYESALANVEKFPASTAVSTISLAAKAVKDVIDIINPMMIDENVCFINFLIFN